MNTAVRTALAVGFLLVSVPAIAHHGTGTYDSTKSVTLKLTTFPLASFTSKYSAAVWATIR